MIIEKKQKDKKRYILDWSYFNSAREGFQHILQSTKLKNKKILVPGYIGYSSREGSGVFDPIRAVKMRYIFYRMDKHLNVDVKGLQEKIRKNRNNILLLIHYFGFKDKNLKILKEYAKKYGMLIIEDFAQAFFTFWLNPIIDFDYGIFSIHKLFPVNSGGMAIGKKKIIHSNRNGNTKYNLFNYNIKDIAEKRIENYAYTFRRMKEKAGLYKIVILKEKLCGVIPHSFPILLQDKRLRDELYFKMNKKGYGMISLYHTLIDEVDTSFRIEHEISNRILNLPAHQDVDKRDLDRMFEIMFGIIKNYYRRNKK